MNNRFELKSWNYKRLNAEIYDNLKRKTLYVSIYELVDLLNYVSQSEYSLKCLKEDMINIIEKIGDDV